LRARTCALPARKAVGVRSRSPSGRVTAHIHPPAGRRNHRHHLQSAGHHQGSQSDPVLQPHACSQDCLPADLDAAFSRPALDPGTNGGARGQCCSSFIANVVHHLAGRPALATGMHSKRIVVCASRCGCSCRMQMCPAATSTTRACCTGCAACHRRRACFGSGARVCAHFASSPLAFSLSRYRSPIVHTHTHTHTHRGGGDMAARVLLNGPQDRPIQFSQEPNSGALCV